jgi:hypothetical protein
MLLGFVGLGAVETAYLPALRRFSTRFCFGFDVLPKTA